MSRPTTGEAVAALLTFLEAEINTSGGDLTRIGKLEDISKRVLWSDLRDRPTVCGERPCTERCVKWMDWLTEMLRLPIGDGDVALIAAESRRRVAQHDRLVNKLRVAWEVARHYIDEDGEDVELFNSVNALLAEEDAT